MKFTLSLTTRANRLARVSDLVVSEEGVFKATLTIVHVGRVWLQSGSESLARTARIAIEDSPRSLAFLADDAISLASPDEPGPAGASATPDLRHCDRNEFRLLAPRPLR